MSQYAWQLMPYSKLACHNMLASLHSCGGSQSSDGMLMRLYAGMLNATDCWCVACAQVMCTQHCWRWLRARH